MELGDTCSDSVLGFGDWATRGRCTEHKEASGEGDHDERQEQRHGESRDDRDRQDADETPEDARDGKHRSEHQQSGHRAGDRRSTNTPDGTADHLDRRLAVISECVECLGDHDGVVDKQAQSQDHPEQRDRAERDADQPQDPHGHGDHRDEEQGRDDRCAPRDEQQRNERNGDHAGEHVRLQRRDLLTDLGGLVDRDVGAEAGRQRA